MSWSWLYDRRDQLDGYKPFAHIAYTLRRHILSEDRDDVEIDIILKLKEVSDKRNGNITPASLWFVGRCMIADYWKRKERERRRYSRIYAGKYGEMVSDSWEYISNDADVGAEIDAQAVLKSLSERLIDIGERLVNGERLNHADKSYLSRQRRKLAKDFHYHFTQAELERMRYLYVEKGLSSTQVARIVGKGHTSVC